MVAKKKTKSAFDSKFTSASGLTQRIVGVREERGAKEQLPLLSISFKDFDHSQCPPGQTYEEWCNSGRLVDLMKKFEEICQHNRIEAMQMKMLKIYDDCPSNSHFKIPPHIEGNVQWGTIQRIGGQKPRLAGYIIDSVFYAVFLDENHLFYPSKK